MKKKVRIMGVKYLLESKEYLYDIKHRCPQCSATLEAKKRNKIVNSNSEEAIFFDFSHGDASLIGNVKFIYYVFCCNNCGNEFRTEYIKKYEFKIKKHEKCVNKVYKQVDEFCNTNCHGKLVINFAFRKFVERIISSSTDTYHVISLSTIDFKEALAEYHILIHKKKSLILQAFGKPYNNVVIKDVTKEVESIILEIIDSHIINYGYENQNLSVMFNMYDAKKYYKITNNILNLGVFYRILDFELEIMFVDLNTSKRIASYKKDLHKALEESGSKREGWFK